MTQCLISQILAESGDSHLYGWILPPLDIFQGADIRNMSRTRMLPQWTCTISIHHQIWMDILYNKHCASCTAPPCNLFTSFYNAGYGLPSFFSNFVNTLDVWRLHKNFRAEKCRHAALSSTPLCSVVVWMPCRDLHFSSAKNAGLHTQCEQAPKAIVKSYLYF